MSGSAKQSNTEARQLAFTAKETHRKGSTSNNGNKFSLRNTPIQKGSARSIMQSLTDSTSSSKNTSTKDWTINTL
eukprot:12411276-Ditylum_brightwellii.AAC.1